MVMPFFDKAGWERPQRDYLIKVIEVMAERANLLTDYVEPIPYFYKDPEEYEEATVKKRWKPASHELLSGWAEEMAKMEEFTPEALEASLRAYAEGHGVGAGQLIHPTRLAITGVGNGPSLFHMMEVLGKEACLRRIEAALKVLA